MTAGDSNPDDPVPVKELERLRSLKRQRPLTREETDRLYELIHETGLVEEMPVDEEGEPL